MSASAVVVMGVSGSGKTTIATALAAHLGWALLDADDLHPPANVAKMAGGRPLVDEDRWPWLADVAAWIAVNRPCVVACSALKRSYRDVLRRDGLLFACLTAEPAELERRLRARTGHYMPPDLLESQLTTLEPLAEDENGLTIGAGAPGDQVEVIVARVMGAGGQSA